MNSQHAWLEDAVATQGCALWGVEWINTNMLVIYVEKPGGVGSDDCSALWRFIRRALPVSAPQWADKRIDVSSPGIERPLLNDAHYEAYLSSPIALQLSTVWEGKKRYQGTLLSYDSNYVTLAGESQWQIPRSYIKKAHVVFEWSKGSKS